MLNEPLVSESLYYSNQGFHSRASVYRYSINKQKKLYDENCAPGWLRFLDIDDICKLGTIIRHTLPHVNIMCNEFKLENRNKTNAFIEEIINPILDYEQKHNIKILDVIGTQCHCSMHTISCDLEDMFNKLRTTGLKIEITEFDIYLEKDLFSICRRSDLHMYKSERMDSFFEVILNLKDKCKIIGFTIYSVNDTMNFIVNKKNMKIYIENVRLDKHNCKKMPYVNNLFGGYYDCEMNERLSYVDPY